MAVGIGVRVGAVAALALGLSLTGPQAVGIATADSGDSDASAVSARPERAASRGVGREARAARVAGVSRPAAAAVAARSSAVVRGPRAAAERTAAAVAVPVAASSESTPTAVPVVAARVAQVRAAAVSVPGAAVASGRSASAVSGDVPTTATGGVEDWAQGVADTIAQLQYEAEAVLADPVGSIQAALDNGVDTVFDTLDQWLSSLPANPISDYLAGALLLVRRSLFDEMTTTNPDTDVLRANGQWEGSLNPSDPWDDSVTYTVTAAPTHGSVQVNTDGTYVYTPDTGYTGPDSFIVEVNDPGFDIFHPFGGGNSSVAAAAASTSPSSNPWDIFAPYFGNGNGRVEDVTVVVDPSSTFVYPSIKNVDPNGRGLVWNFLVERTLYTIDYVPATRQKESYDNVLLGVGDTYLINNYYPDPRVRPPGPGIYFDYRVFVVTQKYDDVFGKRGGKPLWTIEVTQAQGSSTTTTKVKEDGSWIPKAYFSDPSGKSLDDWRSLPGTGNKYDYKIVDVNGPSNSTQQIQLSFFGASG